MWGLGFYISYKLPSGADSGLRSKTPRDHCRNRNVSSLQAINVHRALTRCKASLVAQMVKNPTAVQETWVRSLGREDPLGQGEGQPTPVFLPGELHGQRSLAGYSPWGLKELDTTERLTHTVSARLCKDTNSPRAGFQPQVAD